MSELSKMNKSRTEFEKLIKMYKSYLALFRYFNHGDVRGYVNFADFYWMHHYYYRHKMRRW